MPMNKSILLLVTLNTLSILANGQLFRHGAKAYKHISDTWNTVSYAQFQQDYPKSKFNSEIGRRMQCKQRNDAYPEIITSPDTLRIAQHLNVYDTCLFCAAYLPQLALQWLGKGRDDLSNLHARLDSLRCQYYWDDYVMKGATNDYNIMADFMRKYPYSHLDLRARDSLHTRKDRAFWEAAIRTNNAIGYKTYLDSLPKGAHATEASVLYNDILYGENLMRLDSHHELVEGLRTLKSRKRYSPFTEKVIEKIKKLEESAYQRCIKKKSVEDWLDFERAFSGGFYFAEADKKIRALAKLKANEERSQYGTFVQMINEKSYPINFEFREGSNKPLIFTVKVGQIETGILPSGTYKLRITNALNNEEIVAEKTTLLGQMQYLSCCSQMLQE
jgi:hypothetical protein